MKNIVVLVSGGGTNLQALIDAQKNGKIPNGKITCVISSNPDAYALTRAKENGIGTRVIVPKEFASREMYSKALLEALFQEAERNDRCGEPGSDRTGRLHDHSGSVDHSGIS